MKDTAVEVAKVTPPAVAISLSLPDLVMITTLIYTLIIIIDKLFPGSAQATAKRVVVWIKERIRGKGK